MRRFSGYEAIIELILKELALLVGLTLGSKNQAIPGQARQTP